MLFIHSHWKKNHILARDKMFFKYEHQINNKINYVIARHGNDIIGVLGFIPTSLNDFHNVFTVTWKVIENNKYPVLGVQLIKFLEKLKGVKNLLGVGLADKAVGIYKYLNFYTNKLNQYVIINRELEKYKIAHIQNPKINSINNNNLKNQYNVKKILNESQIDNFNFDDYKSNIPFKTKNYFIKRYFKHPIYKYDVYGLYDFDKIVSLYVTRLQSFEKSHVIRIVDFIGNQNTVFSFSSFISKFIIKKKYEYVDFYCFGLNNETLLASGFELVDPSNENLIIPNYFQPYLKKNIRFNVKSIS